MNTNDLPYLHGMAHRPGGSDPSFPGPLHLVVAADGPSWTGGTDYSPGGTVQDSLFQYVCLLDGNTDIQPGVTSGWPTYWIIDVPVFQNGWTITTASDTIPNPIPAGYQLVNGPPNILDRQTGAIDHYLEHAVDVFGDVSGGSDGTTVFTIPPAYRLPYDKPIPGHDDTMTYVASRLFSTGDFVRGTA